MKGVLLVGNSREYFSEANVNFDFESQGDQLDGTAMLGILEIGGVRFHVNAIRVEEVGEYQEQQAVKGDAEAYAHLFDVYEDAFQTVEIPGYEGEWVLIIHPYGR